MSDNGAVGNSRRTEAAYERRLAADFVSVPRSTSEDSGRKTGLGAGGWEPGGMGGQPTMAMVVTCTIPSAGLIGTVRLAHLPRVASLGEQHVNY